jgi:uncharacterized protein (TIGR02145 family)
MKHYILFILALCFLLSCKKKEETSEVIIERGTVSDLEGRIYQTVKIGDQWWMAENLMSRVFRDSSEMDSVAWNVNEDTLWANSNEALWSRGNTPEGLLYNSAAISDLRHLAPAGWHIATDEDWKKLERFIGMTTNEAGYTGWRGVNEADKLSALYNNGWGANNPDLELYGIDLYGFDARPTGCKGIDGRINIQNNAAYWWAPANDSVFYYRSIDLYHKTVFRSTIHPSYGLCVRCVKD